VGIGWTAAAHIDNPDRGNSDIPRVAMWPNGNGLMAWSQLDRPGSANKRATSRQYHPGPGWSTTFDGVAAGVVAADPNSFPTIVVATAGNFAFALWPSVELHSSRLAPGVGWDAPATLSTSLVVRTPAKLATNEDGKAVAVFAQTFGTVEKVFANRFEVASGWRGAEAIASFGGTLSEISAAMDPLGGIIASFAQYDGFSQNLWVNRYEVQTGWGTVKSVASGTGVMDEGISSGFDGSGGAMVVWLDSQAGATSLRTARESSPGAWTMVTGPAGPASTFPVVARPFIDNRGNAIVTWSAFDRGQQQADVWINRYTTSSGWGTPERVRHGAGTAQRHIAVVQDAFGRITLIWEEYVVGSTSPGEVWSSRFE